MLQNRMQTPIRLLKRLTLPRLAARGLSSSRSDFCEENQRRPKIQLSKLLRKTPEDGAAPAVLPLRKTVSKQDMKNEILSKTTIVEDCSQAESVYDDIMSGFERGLPRVIGVDAEGLDPTKNEVVGLVQIKAASGQVYIFRTGRNRALLKGKLKVSSQLSTWYMYVLKLSQACLLNTRFRCTEFFGIFLVSKAKF